MRIRALLDASTSSLTIDVNVGSWFTDASN